MSFAVIPDSAQGLPVPLPALVHGLAGQLPGPSLTALAEICSLQTLPPGRVLWRAGATPGLTGFVVSGYLRLQCHGRDGHRQILSLLCPGDLVGELPGRAARHTLEACTETRLCRVADRAFLALMREDPALRRLVSRLCIARRDQLRWLTWAVGALAAEERVCAMLLMALDHMPVLRLTDGSLILTLDLPRADVADLLGTSVETISRVTNRLAATGVIEIVSARQFRILDLARLGRIGCQLPEATAGALARVAPDPRRPSRIGLLAS